MASLKKFNWSIKKLSNWSGYYGGKISSGNFSSWDAYSSDYGFDSNSRLQFCVTKMRYSKNGKSHNTFLKTYLPQNNKDEVKNKPEIFGSEDYEEHKVPLHFKFIISPDKTENLNLNLFTRTVVEKIEQWEGRKFYWKAAVHKDTENPHIHLLINGVDKNGRPVKFKKDFLKHKLHEISRTLLTRVYGQRTRQDIENYQNRRVNSLRWTELDKQIFEARKEIQDEKYCACFVPPNDIVRKRMIYLTELNLADYKDGIYYLVKNWDKTLQVSSRYNTFLNAREELKFSEPYNLDLYTSSTGVITGKVEKVISMNDEDIWNNAIVVENKDLKKAWYIPLFNPAKENLKGKNITARMHKNSKGLLVPEIIVETDNKNGFGESPIGRTRKETLRNKHNKKDIGGFDYSN